MENHNKPNILYVVLDTLRADRMGCYGYQRNTTPNLDAFSKEVTFFKQAVAPAQWTIPAHASMFSGEPPTTHLTINADDKLDDYFPTLAEHLSGNGYQTLALSNNPFVGVVDNGFRRGFQDFYSYCGAIPLRPPDRKNNWLINGWQRFLKFLYDFTQPLQNKFSTSDAHLHTALNPKLVPFLTSLVNIKGNSALSVQDASKWIQQNCGKNDKPWFMYLNLMETHLPYAPDESFLRKFAPIIFENKEAQNFMNQFNAEAMRWLIPLEKPFNDMEKQVLNDVYDACAAYEDHYISRLIETLDTTYHRENTLVIFVADHGEMLGEHNLMGHGFGAYEELLHVPLMIRYPEQKVPQIIEDPASIIRLYHTILDIAGLEDIDSEKRPYIDVKTNSLLSLNGKPRSINPISEAYAPTNSLRIMEKYYPGLIDENNSRSTNRAIYKGTNKLLQIEDVEWQLYNLTHDPREANPELVQENDERISELVEQVNTFIEQADENRPEMIKQKAANLDDEVILQQMRDLGYME